jgi:Fe-S cluster assembly protein SufD
MNYLQKQFDALLKYWPDEDQGLRDARLKSFDQFKALGFPTKKWEEWQFTDFSVIEKTNYRLSWASDLPQITDQIPGQIEDCHTVFIINGHYQHPLSDIPDGVTVVTGLDHFRSNPELYAINGSKNPFLALNTSMMNSGVHVLIKPNTLIEKPMQLIYFTTEFSDPLMNHPRFVFHIGKNAQANIIEHYLGVSTLSYFVNSVTQVILDENARLFHVRIQEEAATGSHTASTHYEVKSNAQLNVTSITSGTQLFRHDIQLNLQGKGAEAILNGLSLTDNSQHQDQHVVVNHENDACQSRQLFKYILADKSSGVFNGKVVVHKHTKQTDANQSNKNLLLSSTALMNANPQLEIYSEDVKCAHGSTTGQIDPEELFYLRSRGIDLKKASELIIGGFAKDILDSIKNENVKSYLNNKITNWLESVLNDG